LNVKSKKENGEQNGDIHKEKRGRDESAGKSSVKRYAAPLIPLSGWGWEADKSITGLVLPASAWTGFARMKNARHPNDCATFGRSSAAGMIFGLWVLNGTR